MNLHVIIAEDDYVINETVRKITKDGAGLEVIDSATASNAELQLAEIKKADESFSTPPFLEPIKVTWWKNVHFLPASGTKVAEDVKTALERFAQKLAAGAATLGDNQHFILSGPHLLKTSIFAKTLKSAAEMIVIESGKPWEAQRAYVARAVEAADAVGLAFAPNAAEKFVATVGTDARSIVSEVAKMRCYLGEDAKVISAADVAEITSAGAKVEPALWDVTDAIGNRDISAALAAMRKFELENGFAVLMTTVIEKFFRQLIDVKRGNTKGMNPYAARKNERFASMWELIELRRARARFIGLREKVVSGTTAGDVLVVTELVRVMRRSAARTPRAPRA